ncbi:putative sulfoacetate transporter SauU [Sporomusa silvacetica DSM 10669]|uniref:Sulfoacetate transporter SauU n=1 Tax=Sporomusa silvacetica DSM 10669 TaxID=1123289 RepID=A0ABZ3IFI8_9FIRM|nr:MFS transporter [Sporomusa silvacetica]OZC17147.1 putative sulfoacetate transporter SauU [Sporomusa silvacetica DSM 10669]
MVNQVQKEEYSQYRWVIMALMFASFVLTFLARFAWPPLIPVVVPVLQMNMSQAGAYMTAFYMGYVITQVPAGMLADRFGVRTILGVSLVIEGISTWAMGSITSFDIGFTLRVVTGLGAGAIMSCCARALMEWFPAKERGTAFGLLLAAPSGGLLLANYVVPALNNAFNWQGAFQGIGIATAILGVLIYFLVKTSDEPKGEKSFFGGFKVFFNNRNIVLIAIAGFCLMWMELGLATWANAYVKKLGFSVKEAGIVLIWYSLGGLIAPIVSGWISDKIGNRKNIIIAAYAISVPLTIYFGSQTTLQMLNIIGFVYGFCSYFANPHLSLMVSEYAGKEWAATANGIANFIFQLAPMVGPLILGGVIDMSGSFNTVWYMMAAGPIVGILVLLPLRPPAAE